MKKNKPRSMSPQNSVAPLLFITFRKWGLISAVVGLLLAGGAVALAVKFWEPVYSAKQFVRVVQNFEYTEVLDEGKVKTDPKSVLSPIRSELLLGEMLHKKPLLKRPEIDVEDLKKKIRFESTGGELFSVICEDSEAEFAASVVQILTEEFITYHKQVRDSSLESLDKRLGQNIADANILINSLSKQLAELSARRQDSNSGELDLNDADGEYSSSLLKNVFENRIVLRDLNGQISRLELAFETIEDSFDPVFIEDEINAIPAIGDLNRRIAQLRSELAPMATFGPGYPKKAALETAITRFERQRDGEYQKAFDSARKVWIVQRQQESRELIESKKREVLAIEGEISSYRAELTRIQGQLDVTKQLDFDFDQKLKEQERAYVQLDDWEAKRNRIESKGMSLYRVMIVGPETVAAPLEPVEQYPTKLIAIGFVGGLVLPFVLALAIEFRLHRIGNSEQVRQQVPLQLLGEIADLPVRSHRPSRLGSRRLTKQLRLYEESVDSLSAVLAHLDDKVQRVFSISSAASNEGKTTLSLQLAISSARSNFGRTLLIDADLRSPSLHRLLDDSLEIGLSDVLSETVGLEDAIKETEIDNLDLLTAGKIRTNPRRYFSGTRWADLLAHALEHYDQVIVDTPPILAASESLAISKECDFTLLCMLRDVSRADSVKRAHDRLVSANVRVIGSAFSGVPQQEYASKYGSYEYNM